MSTPMTLLQMAGADMSPPRLKDSVVLLIDCQMEYVNGRLPLTDIDQALDQVLLLCAKARRAGAPIVHVVHKGQKNSLFDLEGPGGRIAPQAKPVDDEPVIQKTLPNAFAGTSLHQTLQQIDRSDLVVAGFMTHMCVSSTIRAGLDLGYRCTIVGKAAATRDLPTPCGAGVIAAADLHRAALAELADRFAIVVSGAADLT